MTTVRGPGWQRWVCALSFWSLMVFSLVQFPGDLADEAVLWVAVDLVLATAAAVLGVRAAAGRIISADSGLELHGLLRSRVFVWSEVAGFEQGSYLGRPANYVRLADGRRVLLPLVTQIGTPRELESVRDQLARLPES